MLFRSEAHCPAAMVNIIGEKGYEGIAKYEGMEEVLKMEGVYPFLYGKKITKPFRKMGHVTITDQDLDSVKQKVVFVQKTLKVLS